MPKRRMSILVDKATFELYELRAQRHGTTVSDEMRQVLDEAVCEENRNQGWLELLDEIASLGEDNGPFPPAGSKEAEEQLIREMYADNFGHEPDW